LTHLPIFGVLLGIFVLMQGIFFKSDQVKMVSYSLFILSAIGASMAYLSGEGAEEVVENIQGITDTVIEEHEEFAMAALIATITLAVASLVGLIFTYRKSSLTPKIAWAILILSFIAFGLVARTGYLGGQIRHSELQATYLPQDNNLSEDSDD
jgi:uncharacterized membrane protein